MLIRKKQHTEAIRRSDPHDRNYCVDEPKLKSRITSQSLPYTKAHFARLANEWFDRYNDCDADAETHEIECRNILELMLRRVYLAGKFDGRKSVNRS